MDSNVALEAVREVERAAEISRESFLPKVLNGLDLIREECHALREAGQKEYAHGVNNAFGNFERIGKELDLDRESVLLVYALKHFDGIKSWVNGHRSQRESVVGRINDAVVYACLLEGMKIQKFLGVVYPSRAWMATIMDGALLSAKVVRDSMLEDDGEWTPEALVSTAKAMILDGTAADVIACLSLFREFVEAN